MNIIEEIIKIKLHRLRFWRVAFLFIVSVAILYIFCLLASNNYKTVVYEVPSFLKTLLSFGVFVIIFVISLRTYERALPLFEFNKWNKRISNIPDIGQWLYQGSLLIENNQRGKSLQITSSNSGALIKDYLYKNFELSCKLSIENGGGIGILFRAQDLENYLMLQIGVWDDIQKDWGDKIVVTPHLRFLGNFETFNIDKREPFFYFSNLQYKSLENKELSINLKVSGDNTVLKVNGEEFTWSIPTHVEPNLIQRPGTFSSQDSQKQLDFEPKSVLWFRRQYGMVGFRAYALERARIKNLNIEKL